MLDLLYSRLNGDAVLRAITGARIYPYLRQQGSELPAVMFEQTDAKFSPTKNTTSVNDEFEFSVNCFSESVSEAWSMHTIVRTNFEGLTGEYTVGSNVYNIASTTLDTIASDVMDDGNVFIVELVFTVSFLASYTPR
tara:strand:- start:26 stop:436 length:411 start_codon:yes stop_codon:yes gene_type:complete